MVNTQYVRVSSRYKLCLSLNTDDITASYTSTFLLRTTKCGS